MIQKMLLIHFYGWSNRFDEWIDINDFRILPKNTKTKKWRNKIKINTDVEVKINCNKIIINKSFWHRSKIIFIRDNRYISIRLVKCNFCNFCKFHSKKKKKKNYDIPLVFDINNKDIVSNINTHNYLKKNYKYSNSLKKILNLKN